MKSPIEQYAEVEAMKKVDVIGVMEADGHAVAMIADDCVGARKTRWEDHLIDHDKAAECVGKLISEMRRYLPVIEYLESKPELWGEACYPLGIATANGYRHILDRIS